MGDLKDEGELWGVDRNPDRKRLPGMSLKEALELASRQAGNTRAIGDSGDGGQVRGIVGAPARIRTCDLRFRNV